MCRDKEHGGRICPSQLNPEKNKAHNAQRRARYNAPKQAKLFPQENFRRGENGSSTHLSKDFVSAITSDQRQALWDYTEMESAYTNKYLHDPEFRDAIEKELDIHGTRDITRPTYAAYKKGLNAAIVARIKNIDEVTAYRLPQATTVYNGFNIAIPEGEDSLSHVKSLHKVGSLYSRPSYMSTSTNPAVAAFFCKESDQTPVVYEILAKHGAPVRELSPLATEDEILLPRDKKFRIVQVKEAVSFDDIVLREDDTITSWDTQSKIIVIQLIEEDEE